MSISFDVSNDDADLIRKIVERGSVMDRSYLLAPSKMTCTMDITAAHANNQPLDLKRFLEADSANFAHDWYGIREHVCRQTGRMLDCFLPRFTSPQAR